MDQIIRNKSKRYNIMTEFVTKDENMSFITFDTANCCLFWMRKLHKRKINKSMIEKETNF